MIAALTTPKGGWWAAATRRLHGLVTISGTAMARMFATCKRLAERRNLLAFSTRLASIIGTLNYGAITWITGSNHRLAITSTALLLVAGLALLAALTVTG